MPMKNLWRRIRNSMSSSNSSSAHENATRKNSPEPDPARNELVLLRNPAKWFVLEDHWRASGQVLGKGTFGTTYKAETVDQTNTVVVKRLKHAVLSAEDFRDKVEALGTIDHENLLPLRGYYYNKDEIFLLYDYMPLGSLSGQLDRYREWEGSPLSWEVRLLIALGAARAIEHLHAQRHPCIHHGNIKSSNVLLTPSYEARVSDYGLTPLKSPSPFPRPTTVAGADPTMVDVYEFGMLLMELLTRKVPTQPRRMEEGVDLPVGVHSVAAEVFDVELMRYHNIEEGMVELMEVAISCVSPNSHERPRMSEVRSKIEELCSPAGQRNVDSQPDKVSEGTNNASSWLIPSAQSHRDSKLDQFSEVNNDTYTRKPPDGVLEVSERIYVFDCCITVDGLTNEDHQISIEGVVGKVQQHFPDAFFKMFNFGEQENQSQMSEVLSYMCVMNYPIHHGDCPILPMEMINLFLRSADAWLSRDEQRCMLLMHCERGGWPVLAFMLAALLLYRKKSNGEEETLHLIYKKAPPDHLHLISPLNPLPSQLRYLQYISTSNVDSEGRQPDKALTLDSVILKFISCLDAEVECHLMFKIFGQDPRNLTDKTPTVLFSTPKTGKNIRHDKKADCEWDSGHIHCPVQGDVVLECMRGWAGREHGETMFRVMFNTAYLRKNVLKLKHCELDLPWDCQDQNSSEFSAMIFFSEMNSAASLVSVDSSGDKEQTENQIAQITDGSQDIRSDESVQFHEFEEEIVVVTVANLEITSGRDCASSSAVSSGSMEATKELVHNSAKIPGTMMLQEEKPCQLDGVTSSTSMSSGYDYDVFLSFRGRDSRSGITDFLYKCLIAAGIHTYRDDKELRIGEEISPELLKAINHSKIAIPIFSGGYASSKWCLNELVQMVDCRKSRRQKIMPIFYYVTPSEVRHQTGPYGDAFVSHEKQFDNKVISKWKAALKEVGSLTGWDINSMTNRCEGELVNLVVQKVIAELKKAYLLVTDCLVGVEHHMKDINIMVCGDSDDIQILGIHGMGGVGKTTLAKIIYNQLSHHFEHCCFLSNVRETSQKKDIECLQNQLLSEILKRDWVNINNVEHGTKTINERLCGKKVLVLLDDVDERIHLNALMGRPMWFGKGSRIIITSRNMDVFNVPEVCCTYELTGMDYNQSLQLFCKHAFRSDHPLEEYAAFSNKVVKITGGLPLALEVIGSQLRGKSKGFWDVTLKKLEKVPHEEVKKKLKICYDALDYRQKQIFLDIACFYIGFDKRTVLHMWTSDLFPGEGLEVLQQRSLIKIGEDNKLWMHVQLRDLGRDIVCQERKKELQNRPVKRIPRNLQTV